MKARGEALRNLRGKMAELHNDAATYEGGYAISCSALFAFIKEIDTILAAQPASPAVGGERKALENCLGCVTAAESEGLHETIEELRGFSDQTDRLIDLVERRLLWVRNYAEAGIAAPPASPLREREAIARIIDPNFWALAEDTYPERAKALRESSLKKADAILALSASPPQQPDPFVLHETVHDGKVIQTVLMPGSGASELVREKPGERANDRMWGTAPGAGVIIDHEEIILAATSTDNCPGEK